MEELITRLEIQIKELIDQHTQLKQSNLQLNRGRHTLTHENELLLVKQQKAISQIQMLVSKLKLIEKLT